MSAIEMYKVNLNNCNGVLTKLYNSRDDISRRIDKATDNNKRLMLEVLYEQTCEEIAEICDWRREHSGCLLQGDDGYYEF